MHMVTPIASNQMIAFAKQVSYCSLIVQSNIYCLTSKEIRVCSHELKPDVKNVEIFSVDFVVTL